MNFDDLGKNIKKAIKILRKYGLSALLRGIRVKMFAGTISRQNKMQQISIDQTLVEKSERCKLAIFTGVPYDDIGGGQRAAQLTRAALKTGVKVLYVYIYPKFDVSQQSYVISDVQVPNLLHKNIKDLSVSEFLTLIEGNASVIFELPHPQCIPYLEIARKRSIQTIFELIDDWSTSLGGDWFKEEVFREFVSRSDRVVGTARVLVQRLNELGRDDAIYLPNAANEYLFDHHRSYKRPADLPEGPIGLYFGSLYGEWFGWDYIRVAAEQNPAIRFCLIGNKPPAIPVSLPGNVHFLGERKIEELPAYLDAADFCLLPFIPNRLTDAVSPIKVFEYLFMAKPVISTNMLEVKDYPGVLIAADEQEFADACKSITADGERESRINKINTDEFVYKNSWFRRLHALVGASGQGNFSAVILMHNNRHIIERSLASLLENCSSYLADVIVIDNASDDGGAEFVADNFPTVKVIKNPVNGCASGRNLGARYAAGRYFAFFDSDQWFTGSFCFGEALQILETHPEVGAVGWAGGWLDLSVEHLGAPIVDNYPNRAMDIKALIRGYRNDLTYLGTGGLFIPRTVFEATGGFDAAYDPTCFEDTDLSFAIKKIGFELAYRDLTCIRHDAHRTTVASDESTEYINLFMRNSKYFQNKWKDYRHLYMDFKRI